MAPLVVTLTEAMFRREAKLMMIVRVGTIVVGFILALVVPRVIRVREHRPAAGSATVAPR